MKERVNVTIDYTTYKNIKKYNISNLSFLIDKLLKNHFNKIECLISQLEEKGYSKEDLENIISMINGN